MVAINQIIYQSSIYLSIKHLSIKHLSIKHLSIKQIIKSSSLLSVKGRSKIFSVTALTRHRMTLHHNLRRFLRISHEDPLPVEGYLDLDAIFHQNRQPLERKDEAEVVTVSKRLQLQYPG